MSNTVTFTHPAGPNEVIVTGDFDNWRQSLPLVKQADGSFNLTMPIPIKSIKDSNRLYFKYVVDGEWIVSEAYPTAPSVENASITNNYVEISDESKRASSFIPESALPINFASSNNSNNNVSKNKKRVKVKRRIRKNKKTGEETVLSEEKQVLDNTTSATEVSDNTRDNTPVVPAQKEEEQEEPKFTTQPVEQEKTTKVGEIPSLAGEPNVVVPTKIEEVKEFTEIREVNQEELNAKLNSELENKEKVEEPTFTTQPVEQEESTKIGQIPTLAGEPGIVIPSNAQEIKEFTEVRDVNQEELNAKLNSELKDKEQVSEPAAVEEQAEEQLPEEQAEETPVVAAAAAAAATAPKKAVASTPSKKESSGCCIIC